MSIKGQGHYLTLVKGHSDFKIKPCFCKAPLRVSETYLLQFLFGVCMRLSGFVRTITCTIMHGFQNSLAQFLPLRRRSAILNIFTCCACATAYSDLSNLLSSFRILITPKKVVLRKYFEWNVSYFGRDLYRND